MNGNSTVHTQLKIFLAMIDADKPLRMSEISDGTGISPQLVHHHLPNMVKDGLVLPVEIKGEKYYTLQAVFLKDDVFQMLSEFMLPVVKYLGSNLSYEHSNIPRQDVITNNLISYIIAISRRVK